MVFDDRGAWTRVGKADAAAKPKTGGYFSTAPADTPNQGGGHASNQLEEENKRLREEIEQLKNQAKDDNSMGKAKLKIQAKVQVKGASPGIDTSIALAAKVAIPDSAGKIASSTLRLLQSHPKERVHFGATALSSAVVQQQQQRPFHTSFYQAPTTSKGAKKVLDVRRDGLTGVKITVRPQNFLGSSACLEAYDIAIQNLDIMDDWDDWQACNGTAVLTFRIRR